MVTCKICKAKMKWIQSTHLKKHDMTSAEYLERFPGARLKDAEMTKVLSDTRRKAERKPCALPGCVNEVVGRQHKYCSLVCSNKHRAIMGTNPITKFGTENYAYKNGLSSNSRKTQKQLAYERDSKTCQKCNADVSSSRYGIHHIIPKRLFEDYREADQVGNLTTLCSLCHKKVEADTLHVVFKLYLDGKMMTREELTDYIKQTLIYN